MNASPIRIAIYGLGLMGGSLGLALKGKGYIRMGIGRNKAKLRRALTLGAVDEITDDLRQGVRNADIVVIALPVELIVPTIKKIKPLLSRQTIVTDVGSVKEPIMRDAVKILPGCFIGSHPMAGTEKSGIRFAEPRLYRGATCAIVRGNGSAKAYRRVKNMWRDAGAKIITIDSKTHDRLVAMCSHLPHVIAFAMVGYVTAMARKQPHLKAMLAGSFRDMTRVAMSDASLWAYITNFNKNNIRAVSREFQGYFTRIISALPKPATLQKMLAAYSTARRNINQKYG